MINGAETGEFHALTPWNPLDQFRLLWWLFLNPARLTSYRNWAGEEATRKTVMWLVSTLIWLPPFVQALGNGLGFPRPIEILSGNLPSLVIAGIIALAWLLIGFFGAKKLSELRLIGVLVVVGVALGVMTGLRFGGVAVGAIGVVIVVAKGVAHVVEQGGGKDVVFGVTLGVINGMVDITAEFVVELGAVVLAVLGVLVVGDVVARVLNRSLESGQASVASKFILLALGLSYAVLVWIYLLGG